jgi:cytochrome P450
MSAETNVAPTRKVGRGELDPGCPAHAGADGVWHVQDYATARAMLRHPDTRQAGFGAEHTARMEARMRVPVLYRDGAEHREHRRQTAKYFTPKRVDTAYRDLMHRLVDGQCDVLRRRGRADVSELSFSLAVAVAAEVIGLTEGRGNMARRLERFFDNIPQGGERLTPRTLWGRLHNSFSLAAFYLRDVRPSAAARRRTRTDDLISHLIDEGCSNGEILGECVTFAAAGMITTREFITLSAWHLFTDDALRASYLDGDEKARIAILHEILRLEPVVANLARTTTAPIEAGGSVIPAGVRVDIGVAAANIDDSAVGAGPESLCPARVKADGVPDAGLSFGDGPHRCPGAYIAIQETDIFLTTLFRMPGLRMVSEPTVGIRPQIAGYELTGLTVSLT